MTDSSIPDLDAKPRKGLLKKLVLTVVGAAVLGIAGFIAGLFYAGGASAPAQQVLRLLEEAAAEADTPEGAQKVPKELPEEPVFQTSYYEFPDPLTTNLEGSRRFLQVGIGVSTQYDAAVIANVETHTMALRSDMLAVISGFTEEEVAGAEGRTRLATALMEAINARLERLEGFGGIEDVFFPSFVLQ